MIKQIKFFTAIVTLVSLLVLAACQKDNVDNPTANFKAFYLDEAGNMLDEAVQNGELTVPVKTDIHFKFQGSALKTSIWTGDSVAGVSHNYEKFIASGNNGNIYNGKSLNSSNDISDFVYVYEFPGVYKVYLVANNVDDKGVEYKSSTAFLTLTVEDDGNTFTSFKSFGLKRLGATYGTNEFAGVISDKAVVVEVPGGADVKAALATFETESGTKVFVGNVEQTSGLTENDFTNEIIYRLVSPNGSEGEYRVSITRLPMMTEAKILSYQIADYEVVGIIDEDAKTISVEFPKGTNLEEKIISTFTSSTFARLKVGSKPQTSGITANFYNQVFEYTVTSEDQLTVATYQVISTLAK